LISQSRGLGDVYKRQSQPTPLPRANNLLFSLFVGIPFLVGSVFCTGDMMGKSIRYLEDKNTKKENLV
jgi:hypothetical protein